MQKRARPLPRESDEKRLLPWCFSIRAEALEWRNLRPRCCIGFLTDELVQPSPQIFLNTASFHNGAGQIGGGSLSTCTGRVRHLVPRLLVHTLPGLPSEPHFRRSDAVKGEGVNWPFPDRQLITEQCKKRTPLELLGAKKG